MVIPPAQINGGTCYEDKTKLGFLEEKVCSALGKDDDHLPPYEILVHGETADQVYMPFFESGFPGGDKENPLSFLSGFLIRGADMNSPLAVTVSGLSCAQSEYIMERLHIMKSDRRCTKGQNAEFIMGFGRRRLSGNTVIKITAGGFANILNFQNHGRGLWEDERGRYGKQNRKAQGKSEYISSASDCP